MSEAIDALICDLVSWVAAEPRPYKDVMDAWRTSCPRLTVWEEAVDRGLVARQTAPGAGPIVIATDLGRRRLAEAGRSAG